MTTVVRLTAALADRYRVERELGAGGMATVYLAHDLKHDRDVAIKVLHPDLAAALGGERFLSEIKTTAKLQHPHILPLLDSGSADGLLFYVMPYIAGETLRTRLQRERQLPIDDALRIAREVADALGAAHAIGIIHRDIKPENILLQGGHALVADFGIALAVQQASGARMTQTGLSLGTPQYMSPEQAMGEKSLDLRSDIYALGAVTYEMLAGEPPFTGPNVQAIVAKVLSSEPEPVTTIRKAVPAHVAAAVHTAIEKLPADRYASAAEFVAALGDPNTMRTTTRTGARASASQSQPWRRVALASMAVALAMIVFVAWSSTRTVIATGPTEYDVGLPDTAGLFVAAGTRFVVSPAGDFVVYPATTNGRPELWFRSLLDGTTRRIEGTDDAWQPTLSSDGTQLAFARGRGTDWTVEVMPLGGGRSTVLSQTSGAPHLEWLADGRILAIEADGNRARRIDPGGGTPSVLPLRYCILPSTLPDPNALLCGGGGAKYAYRIDVRDASREERMRADESDTSLVFGSHFRVLDDRYLVYMSKGGDLLAAPIDLANDRVGRSVRMATGLGLRDYEGGGTYAISASGTLVYALGANHAVGNLVRKSPTSFDTLLVGREAFMLFSVSPEGHRLAAVVDVLDGQELRVYDLRTGKYAVWAHHPKIDQPVWSPDGEMIAFSVRSADFESNVVFVGALDAAGVAERVFSATGFSGFAWLPDGRLFGGDWGSQLGLAAHLYRKPVTIDTLVGDASYIRPSPDGRWIAYNGADLNSLWIERLPRDGKRYQVHAGSGTEDAFWLTSSELVFKLYDAGGRFDRVTIVQSAAPVTNRRFWIDTPRMLDTPGQSSALTPDGRLVYVQGDEEVPARYLRVIPNWVAKMKRAVDEANR